MKIYTIFTYLILYLFSYNKWNLVEATEAAPQLLDVGINDLKTHSNVEHQFNPADNSDVFTAKEGFLFKKVLNGTDKLWEATGTDYAKQLIVGEESGNPTLKVVLKSVFDTKHAADANANAQANAAGWEPMGALYPDAAEDLASVSAGSAQKGAEQAKGSDDLSSIAIIDHGVGTGHHMYLGGTGLIEVHDSQAAPVAQPVAEAPKPAEAAPAAPAEHAQHVVAPDVHVAHAAPEAHAAPVAHAAHAAPAEAAPMAGADAAMSYAPVATAAPVYHHAPAAEAFVVEEFEEEEEEEEDVADEEVVDVEPEVRERDEDEVEMVQTVDHNAELVAQLNDLKAANDLMDQIVELKAENEKLKAELAAGAPMARAAAARGGVARGGVARGAVARRFVGHGGAMATRAPECGIGYISSSGKVISTVAHNATAYVVDGSQHTLAFNQGTAQSNNTFNATQRNSDLILTGTRPLVAAPGGAGAGGRGRGARGAAARRPGAATGRRRRDPNEVGIVNIESDDKVIATVVSESTAYVVDGDRHTLALNRDTALSDNRFAKQAAPAPVAAPVKAAEEGPKLKYPEWPSKGKPLGHTHVKGVEDLIGIPVNVSVKENGNHYTYSSNGFTSTFVPISGYGFNSISFARTPGGAETEIWKVSENNKFAHHVFLIDYNHSGMLEVKLYMFDDSIRRFVTDDSNPWFEIDVTKTKPISMNVLTEREGYFYGFEKRGDLKVYAPKEGFIFNAVVESDLQSRGSVSKNIWRTYEEHDQARRVEFDTVKNKITVFTGIGENPVKKFYEKGSDGEWKELVDSAPAHHAAAAPQTAPVAHSAQAAPAHGAQAAPAHHAPAASAHHATPAPQTAPAAPASTPLMTAHTKPQASAGSGAGAGVAADAGAQAGSAGSAQAGSAHTAGQASSSGAAHSSTFSASARLGQ